MKLKITGILLSVAGIAGLIITLIYVNMIEDYRQVNLLLAGGIAGTVLFFTGIWLLPKQQNMTNTATIERAEKI